MREAFLTQPQKKQLIRYIAGAGENYGKYLEFCKQFGLKEFSPAYLRRWVQRHREKIQIEREIVKMEIAEAAAYGRKRRVAELEADLERINYRIANIEVAAHTCLECGDVHDISLDLLMKATEAKRKLMQAIATELGEWNQNKPPEAEAVDFFSVQVLKNASSDDSMIINAESVKLLE